MGVLGYVFAIIIILVIILISGGIYFIQAEQAKRELSVKPILWMCPSGFHKVQTADGTHCLRNGGSLFVDKNGKVNGASRGNCVDGDATGWGKDGANASYCNKYIPGHSDDDLAAKLADKR
jgi:hypothetical protein